jgi:hypothetical protein
VTRRVAVLGAASVEGAAVADADEVIVLDPSAEKLLAVLDRVQDPRYAFLLGELPVLPLPDAWVDEIVGAPTEANGELTRVRR